MATGCGEIMVSARRGIERATENAGAAPRVIMATANEFDMPEPPAGTVYHTDIARLVFKWVHEVAPPVVHPAYPRWVARLARTEANIAAAFDPANQHAEHNVVYVYVGHVAQSPINALGQVLDGVDEFTVWISYPVRVDSALARFDAMFKGPFTELVVDRGHLLHDTYPHAPMEHPQIRARRMHPVALAAPCAGAANENLLWDQVDLEARLACTYADAMQSFVVYQQGEQGQVGVHLVRNVEDESVQVLLYRGPAVAAQNVAMDVAQ